MDRCIHLANHIRNQLFSERSHTVHHRTIVETLHLLASPSLFLPAFGLFLIMLARVRNLQN